MPHCVSTVIAFPAVQESSLPARPGDGNIQPPLIGDKAQAAFRVVPHGAEDDEIRFPPLIAVHRRHDHLWHTHMRDLFETPSRHFWDGATGVLSLTLPLMLLSLIRLRMTLTWPLYGVRIAPDSASPASISISNALHHNLYQREMV